MLLMDTLASARQGTRLVWYEPLAPPSLCSYCQRVYQGARDVIERAGGIEVWAESVEERVADDGLVRS